jgi:hypothetical protein
MKILAFCIALFIMAVGILGVAVPTSVVWIAQHSATPGAFYLIAAIRVAFGVILISVASASRAPKTLCIFGYLILLAGIATALTSLMAMDHARAVITWWLQQRFGVFRVTGLVLVVFGGFIAYACAPAQRKP